jgi:coenzyme F420 hydrogenase subunit beta
MFGPNELLEDVLKKDLCIGCGACTSLCPYFRPYRGKVAMLFPCTLEEGRCWAHCPKVEVDLDELSKTFLGSPYTEDPLGCYRSIRVSRAGENAAGGAFQAGGTVSALMMFALDKGYVDSAVLTDRKGIQPFPCRALGPEDILKCSSSKYTASPTLSVLNETIKEGYRKIGVVGTPCQVLAASKIRYNLLKGEETDPVNLLVGLFCTWALDFKRFEAFVSKKTDIDKITKIDIPPPPAEIMELFTDNGKVEVPLSEIRELIPNSCDYCIDMTAEFSDISVGVLEGRPDLNTIIIRTDRGERLVEEAEKAGFLALEEIPEENLDHLKEAAGNKKKRAFTKADEQGMINTEASDGRSFLRLEPGTKEKILS